MAKKKLSTISKFVEVTAYNKLLRDSFTAYKNTNDRAYIIEALEYSRKITKLLVKIYLDK